MSNKNFFPHVEICLDDEDDQYVVRTRGADGSALHVRADAHYEDALVLAQAIADIFGVGVVDHTVDSITIKTRKRDAGHSFVLLARLPDDPADFYAFPNELGVGKVLRGQWVVTAPLDLTTRTFAVQRHHRGA